MRNRRHKTRRANGVSSAPCAAEGRGAACPAPPTSGGDGVSPDRPLRIVWLAKAAAPDVGGVQKYVYEVARILAGDGHHFTLMAGDRSGRLAKRDTCEGIHIRRFPTGRSATRLTASLWRNLDAFLTADVIHVSDLEILELYHATLGWLLGPRPVFLTRHGMSGRFPLPAGECLRARRAALLAWGTVDDGAFIEKRLGVAPDVIINPGLRPTADELPRSPEPEPRTAVFLGRLEPDTGIELYLQSLAFLRERDGIHLRLDVYGEGTLKSRLAAWARARRLPVVWHPARPRGQMLLHQGQLAFVSGRMAIFEAMARRRPVIAAYPNPLKRDYICGEWFSPFIDAGHTPEQIADHVARLVRDPFLLRARVEAAYEAVRGLDWRHTADAYLALWRTKLAEPRWGRTLGRGDLLRLALRLWRERRGAAISLLPGLLRPAASRSALPQPAAQPSLSGT